MIVILMSITIAKGATIFRGEEDRYVSATAQTLIK